MLLKKTKTKNTPFQQVTGGKFSLVSEALCFFPVIGHKTCDTKANMAQLYKIFLTGTNKL